MTEAVLQNITEEDLQKLKRIVREALAEQLKAAKQSKSAFARFLERLGFQYLSHKINQLVDATFKKLIKMLGF